MPFKCFRGFNESSEEHCFDCQYDACSEWEYYNEVYPESELEYYNRTHGEP